jgi:beta-glucanase (GH16 family)
MIALPPSWPAVLLTGALLLAACGTDDPPPWQLVWSDEFDGPAGSPPDASRWSFETGGHGWGNNEEQFYTDRPANAALDGAGALVITARREVMGARNFTSGRIVTRGKFQARYGRFEARLKLPAGKGLWPAFWMLGQDVNEVGWPGCGEIDVVEARGAQPWRVSGAAHGPGYSGGNALTAGFELPGGKGSDGRRLTDDFHLYAVEWEPEEIRFFVDQHLYHSVRATRLPPQGRWVYDHPFFLLLNLAVGGSFGGSPDATTPFPAQLIADHVRVFTR